MDEFREFIQNSKSTNTLYSETTSYNVLKRYLLSVDETREPNTILPQELCVILCRFYMYGTKLDGTNFEPGPYPQ